MLSDVFPKIWSGGSCYRRNIAWGERVYGYFQVGQTSRNERYNIFLSAKTGEKLTLVAKPDGTIVLIDVIAYPGEKRQVQTPGQSVVVKIYGQSTG